MGDCALGRLYFIWLNANEVMNNDAIVKRMTRVIIKRLGNRLSGGEKIFRFRFQLQSQNLFQAERWLRIFKIQSHPAKASATKSSQVM